MIDIKTVELLIQQSLDLLMTSADWNHKASLRAHIVGLQGEKRRLRYLHRKAENIADTLQHSAYDLFGLELYPDPSETDVSDLETIPQMMDSMIEKSWKVYDGLHKLANDMVVAKLKSLSEPLYDFVSCLISIISELERAKKEYILADWEYHHISRYQVSYYNVHDEYEKKEESQGYKDHKEA